MKQLGNNRMNKKLLRDIIVIVLLVFLAWIALKIFFFTLKHIFGLLLLVVIIYLVWKSGIVRKFFPKK